ncbi:MAG: cbb3-type cytochrome c oxidase subunit I [Planctomycetes bacterium]|nr:cbb3-type cytochrome c oxidase subunit I [Planctomycetota bacterium]
MSATAMGLPEIKRYTGVMDWLTTVDHKKIGLLYFWFTLTMGIVGGFLAGGIRLQLAMPGAVLETIHRAHLDGTAEPFALFGDTDRGLYNQFMTMHASVMIFMVIIPSFASFGNYLVPLMIGARDMAFPKMNGFAFWLLIPAALLMFGSFFVTGGAAQSGWTAYPPLSINSQGPGQDMWILGVHIAGLSSILGAINFLVTMTNMRAPGMTWLKMPLFCWAVFITSILQFAATPVLASAVTMLLTDRNFGTTFLDASKGGDPVLYQHIFWFYSHPAVYIMVLPGFGAVTHIIAAFSQKRVFGYLGMVLALAAIALLGFVVWAHHMFSVGMPTALLAWFMYASYGIGVPTGVKIFSWIATMWGGNIRFTTAMKFACGMVSLFVLGGFGGLILATVPIDYSLHDTYYVVGHFHYTLVGGSVMVLFGMTYFWWPKMTGRMLNETVGSVVFWFMFLGVLITFATMHVSGIVGMPRRIPVYYEDFKFLNHITTFGYLLTIIGALIFFVQVILSMRKPMTASDDPWAINDLQGGLEWATSSPPPVYNFAKVPPIPIVSQMPEH